MHPENTLISINHDDSNQVQGEANCAVLWEFDQSKEQATHDRNRQRDVVVATILFIVLSVFSTIVLSVFTGLPLSFNYTFGVITSGVISRAIFKKAMEKRLGRKLIAVFTRASRYSHNG